MTPAQCRAARGLLNWNQDDLATAAAVSSVTVRNFENEKSVPQRATLGVMRAALESAGVEFTNGGQPGVRPRGHVFRLDAIPERLKNPAWKTSGPTRRAFTRADDPSLARRNVANATFAGGELTPGSVGLTSPWLNETLSSCVMEMHRHDIAFGAVVGINGERIDD